MDTMDGMDRDGLLNGQGTGTGMDTMDKGLSVRVPSVFNPFREADKLRGCCQPFVHRPRVYSASECFPGLYQEPDTPATSIRHRPY